MIILKQEDKEWIERALDKDFTRLQMKDKLQKSNYTPEKIEAFLDYYDVIIDKRVKESIKDMNPKKEEVENKEFRESVKKYFEEGKSELSWGEKRQIKKFIKRVDRCSALMKSAIDGYVKEIAYIGSQDWDKAKVDTELKYLKNEIIDRLLDSREILEIENPVTKEEITKENLKELDLAVLIKLMQENVEALDMVVNGKVTE